MKGYFIPGYRPLFTEEIESNIRYKTVALHASFIAYNFRHVSEM
jgi:hypothetical protein